MRVHDLPNSFGLYGGGCLSQIWQSLCKRLRNTPVPKPGLGAFTGDGKVQSISYFVETDFMHLYIVRHGETWANAEHRYLGSLDPELTALGRQQAQTLCEQLPASLDVLVVSPRLRAVQTASILNERLKLSPEIMDCFRERDVGVFEG